jgi:predicted peroxiredoxin
MSKSYFMMFSTDPDVDPRKCIVGLACTAQAIADGHEVVVFFASHAVKLLQSEYINTFDAKVAEGQIEVEHWTKSPEVVANAREKGISRSFLDVLLTGAEGIYCSTGSQAVVGVTPENASDVLVEGLEMNWSGPPGVIALSAASEVSFSF